MVSNKEDAVIDLIQNVLPEILPRLFPYHEGGRWVHRAEYEHPEILEHKAAQSEVRQRANDEVLRIEQEIKAERERLSFLHGILTKSDNDLVKDVKKALEFIGFRQVVDVDEAEANETNKQEDLQILDKSPSLLLEVKGVTGLPTERDTLQVTKFVLRRMREWERTDVIGVSLINHQRNLPALDRDYGSAFTTQQIKDAELNRTGLMTTWDLFRLIRGMMQWEWPAETIRDLFFGHGRLPLVPSHYIAVGTVAHYWTENAVISIDMVADTLHVTDRVGYLFADGFFEEEVVSLELDRNPLQEARPPQRIGMKTTLARSEIPVGTMVFRVAELDKAQR